MAAAVKQKNNQNKIEFVECGCCGLTEECTPAYIARVREKFEGHWLCGLCSEAVKYETTKSAPEKIITTNEALIRHMKFCQQFKSSSPPENPAGNLITAMKHLLLRSLDSPRKNKGPNGSRS
ncbi:hypothetical protein V6N13_031194 [Hibiscus sabdariffa]|uniref:DUF1677 family protein n=1 Tax=Hibiscus sabdariffa TaxID=183260 RepID=A0ABR2CL17_9ROSI